MARRWNRIIAVGVAAVAIASLAGAAPAAYAATRGHERLSGGQSLQSRHYRIHLSVEFTTSLTGALAPGAAITITDTVNALPGLVSDYNVDAAGHNATASNISGSGGSVTINTPLSGVTIGNSTQVIVKISGVTTPTAGPYTAGVSTTADSTPVTTTYTIGTATQVVATAGNNQPNVQVNATFLRVSVPISGTSSNADVDEANISVVYTAVPGTSGASGTFANGTATTTVTTNSSGLATSTLLTANSTAGTFTVTAAATVGSTF